MNRSTYNSIVLNSSRFQVDHDRSVRCLKHRCTIQGRNAGNIFPYPVRLVLCVHELFSVRISSDPFDDYTGVFSISGRRPVSDGTFTLTHTPTTVHPIVCFEEGEIRIVLAPVTVLPIAK